MKTTMRQIFYVFWTKTLMWSVHCLQMQEDNSGVKFGNLCLIDNYPEIARKLESLELYNNRLGDVCLNILVDALANKNTKLKSVELSENNQITNSGWLVFLPLVCNTSSIKSILESNHTIRIWTDLNQRDQDSYSDDVNLLRASMEVNLTENKVHVKRQKIIWAHARNVSISYHMNLCIQ